MVTANNDHVISLWGSSDDEKPLVYNGIVLEQGSSFVEIDTSKIFVLKYDSATESMVWEDFGE